MSGEKIYNCVEITSHSVGEFGKVWAKESLPYWEKHGIKHIGSWNYWIGGPSNEILRIFEFESFSHYEQWQKFLREDPEGQALMKLLHPYIIKGTNALLNVAPFVTQNYHALSDQKIYNLVRITSHSPKEFSEFWARESLPYWEKHDIKHIGSWQYWAGGPNKEIIRIFEFDNLTHFAEWQSFLSADPVGKDLMTRIHPYVIPGRAANGLVLLRKVSY